MSGRRFLGLLTASFLGFVAALSLLNSPQLLAAAVSPVQSITCSAGQFINQLAATGIFTCSAAATTSGNNSWSGTNTFGPVKGTARTVSGTSDTILSTDCGKAIVYTSASAVTLTTLASIVSGTDTCSIAVFQSGAGTVTISDGVGATHAGVGSCTATSAQFAIMELFIEPNNPSKYIIGGQCA